MTSEADGAVMITGTHNPPDYNGFKMMLGKKPFFGAQIQELGRMAAEGDVVPETAGTDRAAWTSPSATPTACWPDWDGGDRALKVVWDPGNGSAGPIVKALAARLPGTHIVLNGDVDGTFPNHHPDPTVPKNLEQLIAEVTREKADLGIAFDGDGDRIGVVDDEGHILFGDQLLIVLARDVLKSQAGRHHHRRREGEPGAVRRDRQGRRQAADVEDRPFADQGQDGRDRLAARRRDVGPHLLRRQLVRLRRRALFGGAAARHRRAHDADRWPTCAPRCRR